MHLSLNDVLLTFILRNVMCEATHWITTNLGPSSNNTWNNEMGWSEAVRREDRIAAK
jgi:hypothetical protein